jgi:hypothetical protein
VKTYDKAGRQIREVNYVNEGPNLNPRTTVTDYDDDGRTTQETHYNIGAIESIVKFGDAGSTAATRYNGYDAASVLRGYKVDVYVSGAYKYTTSYQNAYRLGEGYQDTGQSVSSAGTSPPGPATNTRVYDVNGDLVQFSDSGDVARTRYFANNASGQVLTTIQGQFDGASGRMTVSQAWDAAVNRSTTNQPKAQYFFFADGKHTGSFGQLQNPDGTFDANFDVNYTPVSSNYPASAPSQVIAQTGDTLRTIAARIFGDGSLWYVLAQENGLSDPTAPIKEGTVIKVPNEVVSLSNTSGSFKPFDAGDALGDTSPTQPAPPAPKPKKGGCGVIGMIIVAIVAIVVTVFTAGAAAAALLPALGSFGSAVVGGAIGAAVGSIASQGVGIAIGVQDKFSWGAVAKAAIGGAIGGALFGVSGFDGSTVEGVSSGILKGGQWMGSAFGKATGFVQGAFNSAASSVLTQGVSMAFGLQEKFSWREVAASAAGGGVGAVVGDAAGGVFGKSTIGNIATRTVTGFTSGVTQAVVRGGKIDYESIAADAFGNALGNAIGLAIVDRNIPREIKKLGPEGLDRYKRALKAGYSPEAAEKDVVGFMGTYGLLRYALEKDGAESPFSSEDIYALVEDLRPLQKGTVEIETLPEDPRRDLWKEVEDQMLAAGEADDGGPVHEFDTSELTNAVDDADEVSESSFAYAMRERSEEFKNNWNGVVQDARSWWKDAKIPGASWLADKFLSLADEGGLMNLAETVDSGINAAVSANAAAMAFTKLGQLARDATLSIHSPAVQKLVSRFLSATIKLENTAERFALRRFSKVPGLGRVIQRFERFAQRGMGAKVEYLAGFALQKVGFFKESALVLKNNSDNGLDFMGKTRQGEWVSLEIKASRTSKVQLKGRQKDGASEYTYYQLNQMSTGMGIFTTDRMTLGGPELARRIMSEQRQFNNVQFGNPGFDGYVIGITQYGTKNMRVGFRGWH